MSRPRSTLLPATALLGLVAGAWLVLGPVRGDRDEVAPELTDGAPAIDGELGAAPGSADGRERTATRERGLPVLTASEVCGDVGYLCAGLQDSSSIHLFHWPAETPVLDVLVPPPPHEPPERAAALQRAARRGIARWDGIPLPVRISLRETGGRTPHVVLRWVDQLPGEQLGATEWRWEDGPGGPRVTIADFVLATRAPAPGNPWLSPEEVELTAAHEMGHVLGLPHSDSEQDVMYPKSTAYSVTPRDFRTARALYRLPPGAIVRR